MAIQFLSGFDSTGNSTVTGTLTVTSISNDNGTYTGILVWDGNVLKYRTKSQILSDIGATGNLGTVTSVTVQGTTGLSGSGTVTSSGTITLTNSDRGSSQSIYKNVTADSGGTATANSNNDTLTITGTGGTTTSRSGDTITINSSDNNDNYYVTGLSFNTSNGVLTASRNGGLSSLTVDLDGRYVDLSNSQSIAGEKTFSSTAFFTNAGGIRTNQVRTQGGQQLVLNAGESSSYATGQTGEFVYLNAESGIQINSSPDNWSSGWAGRKTTTINDSSGNSTFANDITVSGGDITLGGTGRIQGVDTVSANTDAANKSYVDTAVASAGSGTFLPLAGGTMTGTTTHNDNVKSFWGTANDGLQIYHNGSNSFISDTGTGLLVLSTNTLQVYNAGITEFMITAEQNGAVNLYYDGSKKFETKSDGGVLTGNLTVSQDLTVSGGDITLSGTGRIQGVDTVSAGTDAANKTYVDNAVSGSPQGTVTSVATGDGLTGGTITGSGTVSVDYGINGIMNDCPFGTGSPEEDDSIMVGLDSGGQGEARKFAIVDLPFGVGDITAVTAGNGLSGGGTSGSVTLNVGAGKGINVNANDVEVNYGATSNVIMDAPNTNSLEGKDFFLFADFSNNNAVNYTDLSTLSSMIISNIGTLTNLTISNTLSVRGAIDLADNDILRFGTGDDVEMFFNGSDMFMDINNGEDFKIRDGNSGNAVRFTFDADNGNFTATGNITAFSDERLKDNIETLDGSKVLDMRGVSYTKDGKAGSGVIAQELEKVAPELVMTNEKEDGMKSVAYGNLVGYLIEAVKDQQKQIDELKAQLDGLSK